MLRSRIRYEIRRLAYSKPLEPTLGWIIKLGRIINKRGAQARAQRSEADRWDEELRTTFAPYLDSTLIVMARARLIGTLARHLRGRAVSAIDLGCGGGQLAEALFECGFQRYVGVDVSRLAIETARKRMNEARSKFPADCRFETGELGNYWPSQVGTEARFDLIVLSEVLYYLPTSGHVLNELKKCASWLNTEGLISISLKDDGKSHAIMRAISGSFDIVSSFLFQASLGSQSFRVQIDQERPAYLISMLAPK